MSSFNLYYKKSDSSNPVLEDTRNLTFKTTGGIAFQYFWSVRDQKIKIALVLFLSVCSGCLNFFFVEKAKIYNPGLFSVWQSIARCVKSFSSNSNIAYILLFWVLNSIVNLILATATYKVIGKEMTKLSVCFILGSALTGVALSNMPDNWGFQKFSLFSDPFKNGEASSQNGNGKNINFLIWDLKTETSNPSSAKNSILILFMYAVVFSVLNALIASLLYALGGCGGGIDWIIFYLFKAKSYFANKLIFYTGLIFLAFSYLTGSFIPWAVNKNHKNDFSSLISGFFSPLFFALLASILVRRFIFNVFYPRFKFINVKIFTNKFLEIRKALLDIKFPHSFTIVPSFGSYSLRSQAQLEFICLLVELQELIKVIRKIDRNCFICSLPIKSLNARIQLKSR